MLCALNFMLHYFSWISHHWNVEDWSISKFMFFCELSTTLFLLIFIFFSISFPFFVVKTWNSFILICVVFDLLQGILGNSISKLHKDCHQWISHYDTEPTKFFWMLVSSWRVADLQLVSFSNRQNTCQNILRQRCRFHFLSTANAMFTVLGRVFGEGGKPDWFHKWVRKKFALGELAYAMAIWWLVMLALWCFQYTLETGLKWLVVKMLKGGTDILMPQY